MKTPHSIGDQDVLSYYEDDGNGDGDGDDNYNESE